jgi:hypothetical protein
MRRTIVLTASFLTIFLGQRPARADLPPPEQVLESDPERPRPRLGTSADAVGIILGDYALRLEGAPDTWHALTLDLGASRRHGGDGILVELGWTVFPMAIGLEGFFVHPAVGVAWAGPWNGSAPGARSVLRFGGEIGWQFLWEDLSITLAAGAMGFVEVSDGMGQGDVWPEPRGRVALGFVLR